MFKLLVLATVIFSGTIVSIYSLSVTDIDKNSISFNSYKDKKILIVNTASAGSGAAQLAELEQLYQRHKDSMVVIAFPSNSFGNEPGNDQQIKTLMQGTYGITFPVAAKSCVKGDSANAIYQWLGNKIANDVMEGKVKRDFQKFLIDKTGSIVGRFDSSVSPLSTAVQNAILNN
ncbi:glutathione peroxidase [Ferruginibacter profundus]